ncbi:MAG: rhomboid family intramembrane serine protease [Acidobacteriaceae bacterium]
MPRSGSMMLSFPPFAGMIRKIILVTVAIFFLLLVLRWIAPGIAVEIFAVGALTPTMAMHGAIWQLITYSFLSGGILQIAFDMLSLWFIGSYLETTYGTRWLTEIYFFSVVGAALTTIVVSYTHIFHMSPNQTIYGALGGIFGLLAAWAVLMGDQKFLMFPLPISIRAKYLVMIFILIALASVFQGPSGFLSLASLGGALFGYIYIKVAPRRGYAFAATERVFSLRNGYYRWKRRRAARKFEVYMRKHDRDVKFDGQGRYIDPDGKKDPTDKRWMN